MYCVNDGAVMKAWAADQGITADSLITFMADPRSELTSALSMGMDHPGPASLFGQSRSKRFSALAVDGVFKIVNVAEGPDDPAGDTDPSNSLCEKMMTDMAALA